MARELVGGKCRPRVSLGGEQVAASEREPAAVRKADGKPAAVSGCPRLGDRGVEQRPHFDIASAHSRESVACENQVASENHGLPAEPGGVLCPARIARLASSAPTTAGSF